MRGGRLSVGVAVVVSLLAVGAVVVPSLAPAGAVDGPTVSLGDASGLERDVVTGSVFVPVFLSEPAAAPVVVSFFTVDGSATAGADYTRWGTPSSPRSVTIPAGSLQSTINVPVLADGAVEPDESFSVEVSSVSGGDAVVGDGTGVATIVDADGVSGVNPAITVSSGTVVEGDGGQRRAQFQVHLSRAPLSNVTITYRSLDGTAVAPGDYTAKLPGTVVFAPGQISKTVDVSVGSNSVAGGDRSLSLEVAVTGGSPVEELAMSGLSTIVEDDPSAVSCVPGTYSMTGVEPCVPAPAGFFVDTAGALTATPCPVGSYQPSTGRTSCLLAQIGSYVDVTAAQDITPCPEGTTTPFDGATSLSDCVPIVVPQPPVTDLSVGPMSVCAVVPSGEVVCWGRNSSGQLGDGTTVNRATPVTVSGLTGATQVDSGEPAGSFGAWTTCARRSDGTAWCWGYDGTGAVGNGTAPGSTRTPQQVAGLTDVEQVSTGNIHACARTGSGAAWCWGWGIGGRLGDGDDSNHLEDAPVQVVGLSDVVDIDAGSFYSCAVRSDGTVWCWGINGSGNLGDGGQVDSAVPVQAVGITDAVEVAVGYGHTCARRSGGGMWCWGSNFDGQVGNVGQAFSTVPVPVTGIDAAVQISVGYSSTCAVLSGGTVACWGRNSSGALGFSSGGADVPTPVVVPGLSGITGVSVNGQNHFGTTGPILGQRDLVCFSSATSVRCSGSNEFGQLGDGTTTDSSTPVQVVGL